MSSDAWAVCREIRRRAGLNQRELAARAGVTPATIARIEKGRMEPTLDLLQRIARGADFDIVLSLSRRDADDEKAKRHSRSLTDEQRLRQNDQLSILRMGIRSG